MGIGMGLREGRMRGGVVWRVREVRVRFERLHVHSLRAKEPPMRQFPQLEIIVLLREK